MRIMDRSLHHFGRLRILFWTLLLVNVAYIAWMKHQLAPLSTNEILSFEISRTTPVATRWVNSWKASPPKYEKAVDSMLYDYVFILLYVSGLISAVLFLARLSYQDLLIRSSRFIALLVALAGLCDIIENLFLTTMLREPAQELAVRMGYNFAAAKFSILILAVLFLFICSIFFIFRPTRRQVPELN